MFHPQTVVTPALDCPIDNDMWLPSELRPDLSRDEDLLRALQQRSEREYLGRVRRRLVEGVADNVIPVRFTLRTEKLSLAGRMELEALGVECLEEGGAYEVFGIVVDSVARFSALTRARSVRAIYVGETRCEKTRSEDAEE